MYNINTPSMALFKNPKNQGVKITIATNISNIDNDNESENCI
jgi:hypothetical protein